MSFNSSTDTNPHLSRTDTNASSSIFGFHFWAGYILLFLNLLSEHAGKIFFASLPPSSLFFFFSISFTAKKCIAMFVRSKHTHLFWQTAIVQARTPSYFSWRSNAFVIIPSIHTQKKKLWKTIHYSSVVIRSKKYRIPLDFFWNTRSSEVFSQTRLCWKSKRRLVPWLMFDRGYTDFFFYFISVYLDAYTSSLMISESDSDDEEMIVFDNSPIINKGGAGGTIRGKKRGGESPIATRVIGGGGGGGNQNGSNNGVSVAAVKALQSKRGSTTTKAWNESR